VSVRAREAQEAHRQARPERVYVTIAGKRVPFVSSAKAAQQRPIAKIEQAISEKNIEVSNILKYETPEPIRNFIDSIDRRAQLSFRGEKPLNPFAFRNVAEALYGIEKGSFKGVIEEPLTAGTSLLVGGALTKGAGVLASRAPILTRGVGSGKVTSKISALNVASAGMAGYYGADVAGRVAAANNRMQEIGKILSTEIVPFVAGARFAQVPIGVTVRHTEYAARRLARTQKAELKRFIKDENARMGADIWSKIPTQRQTALKQGRELKRTIQFGKTFKEPEGKGVTVVSGKQQLIAIQETKLKPQELKQVTVTKQKQATVQLQQQIQVTKQQQVQITEQIQKQIFIVPSLQKQRLLYKQKQKQAAKQVQKAQQVQKKKVIQFTPQKISYAIYQVQQQQQKAAIAMKQIQKQVSIQKPVQKQVTNQVQRKVAIQKRKTLLTLATYQNQLGEIAKAHKKRGKFVWNIKNQIPTLESLIG